MTHAQPSERMIMIEAVQPGTADWDELVATCRDLINRRNWVLGDAALRIAPELPENTGGSSAAADHLARFAAEVEVSYHSIREYRRVAEVFPEGHRRHDIAWRAHRELVSSPDLIHDVKDSEEAREAAGRSRDSRISPKAPSSERARFVREQLADPEVRRILRENEDEANARLAAHGGHVPSATETAERYHNPIMEAISGAIDDEDAIHVRGRELLAAAKRWAALGPFDEDSDAATLWREVQLIGLDSIVSKTSVR